MQSASDIQTTTQQTEKVVIVGAGPAGLLLAHYLLQQSDARIAIYERLPDPELQNLDNERTFPISLQLRGMEAIKGIDQLESAVIQSGSWSEGTVMHSGNRQIKIPARSSSLLTHRNGLTRVLLSELRSRYDHQRLEIHFNSKCTGLDEKLTTITVIDDKDQQKTVRYDRLVAADGARSKIRSFLADKNLLQCSVQEVPNAYKSLDLKCSIKEQHKMLAPNRVHACKMGRGNQLLMVPQGIETLRGTLIFPNNKNPLQSFQSPDEILAFFQKKCPELKSLLTLADARRLLEKPVSRNLTVRCDRMHVGSNILLLGDAVHAVSASIGQGCNAALQDTMVFARLLHEHQGNWEQALPAFTKEQLPNAHALRELSDFSYPLSGWMNYEFMFRVTLGRKLARWIPNLSRPLPSVLVTNTLISYSKVLEQSRWWIDRVKRSRVS